MIDIVNKSGKTTIKLSDSADGKDDTVIVDGKEVPYLEAAAKAEEEGLDPKKKPE